MPQMRRRQSKTAYIIKAVVGDHGGLIIFTGG